MKQAPCKSCGLIQLYDEIFGLCICDSNEAQLYGCPDRELVKKNYPEDKYDEKITYNPRRGISTVMFTEDSE